MSYMELWMGWTTGRIPDAEIVARMHIDPFFKRWFENRRRAMADARERRVAG